MEMKWRMLGEEECFLEVQGGRFGLDRGDLYLFIEYFLPRQHLGSLAAHTKFSNRARLGGRSP